MVDATPTPASQSMEDILASIKRIMREPADGIPPAPDEAPPPRESEDDVLELGPAAALPAAAIPAPVTPPAPSPPPPPSPEPLLSAPVREASRQAMAPLQGLAIDPDAPGNTLDGLVRELLRPMLKEWLDANLPDLVERVVAREIARLGAR